GLGLQQGKGNDWNETVPGWPGTAGRSDAASLGCGIADVAGGRQRLEVALGGIGDLQLVYELLQRLGRDALATGQLLELLVGLRHGVTPHDGLHGLGEHFPAVIQVFSNTLNIELQLADSLEGCLIGNHAVSETNPQVSQHSGVGQVPLPARDRQLAGQVLENGVGDTQVAFGVFEVDRVDLVRHGRGANLASDGLLLEVAQGDITPDVPVEIDQDGIEPGHSVIQLGDIIVRLDLRSVGVEGQAEGLFDELPGVGLPIQLRVGRQVGIVIAYRAVDLAQQGNILHLADLPLEAVNHVGQFLAQGSRRGRLTVGARQHGHVGKHDRQRADLISQAAHQRQYYLVPTTAQHQGVGEVVDVLGSAGKVDEFIDLLQLGQGRNLLLEQIFHRLDVVIGGPLDFLDALGVAQLEVIHQPIEQGVGLLGKGTDFRNAGVRRQTLQPTDLDLHTEADQAIFTENAAQAGGLAAVTAINGCYGGQGGKLHRKSRQRLAESRK